MIHERMASLLVTCRTQFALAEFFPLSHRSGTPSVQLRPALPFFSWRLPWLGLPWPKSINPCERFFSLLPIPQLQTYSLSPLSSVFSKDLLSWADIVPRAFAVDQPCYLPGALRTGMFSRVFLLFFSTGCFTCLLLFFGILFLFSGTPLGRWDCSPGGTSVRSMVLFSISEWCFFTSEFAPCHYFHGKK